jgi:hypothetical protein
MKKISLLFLLSLYGFTVNAQEQRTMKVFCDKTEVVMNSLQGKYYEIPILAGQNLNRSHSTLSVWGNPATNTFTILDTLGDTTCVIAVGDNLTILLNDPQGKDI